MNVKKTTSSNCNVLKLSNPRTSQPHCARGCQAVIHTLAYAILIRASLTK